MGTDSSLIEGTFWIGSADGWTEIGRTDGGSFEWLPPLELAGLDGEFPFARLDSVSMTITVPLTRAARRMMHVVHGGRGSMHGCAVCNPQGRPPPLAIDGREYHRRQLARKRRRR
jgi:hypothetical protein